MNGPTVVKGSSSAVRVFIPGHPPGGNERKRAHWRTLKRVDDQWKDTAYLCALDAAHGKTGLPYGKCIVTVEFHYRLRNIHDWDNMAGELKGLMDGLSGVIWKDDNTGVITELRMRHIAPSNDGIWFIVEPLQEALF